MTNWEPCGCYTDEEGYWVLSAECRKKELEVWGKMLKRWELNKFINRGQEEDTE
jgi:hypothetical protein